MSNDSRMRAALVVALLFGTTCTQAAVTNGFNQTGAGPYDYNNTANWVGGVINGIWDSSLTNAGAQTVTFGTDTTLLTPLTFNYAGNGGLNLRSDGVTNRTLTLGGDVTVNPFFNQTVSFGSATANQNLNLNLGGVTRTLTVNAGKALALYNSVTNGALVCSGGANFFLYGPNYQTATILTNGGALYLDGTAALGPGTLTLCNGTTIGNNTGITTNSNNTAMAWNGSFTFAASQNLSLGNGPVTLAGPMTLTANGWTLTVGGAISGGNGIFDVTKAGGGGIFVYNPATALTTNQTINVAAGTETLNGAISGSGYSLTKAGAGTLNLNGANSYSGGTMINGGVVQFAAGAVPSSGLVAINAGGTLNAVGAYANAGAWVASGKIATNSAGTLMLTGSDSSSIDFSTSGYTALYLGASANSTLSGTLTAGPNGYFLGGGGAILTLPATNALSGNQAVAIGGNVTLTGSNSVSGVVTINSGTLTLANSNGALVNADQVAKAGTTLAFDSSISGVRGITRARSVTLKGAALTVTGNSGTNSVDTITGALTVDAPSSYSGANTITLTSGAGRNCQLNASSLVRTNNGAVLVRGTNLGQTTIASTTANSANLSLGAAPALVGGGGAAGSQNISIIPWAFGDTNAAGGGSSFVTYDAANGIRPLAPGEYDTSITGGTVNSNNVSLTIAVGATTTVTGASTVNALFLTGGGATASTFAGSGPLTVTSGAVYGNYGASGNGLAITKQLDFGAAQGIIGSQGGNIDQRGLFISGGVSGSGGLVLYNTPTANVSDNGPYFTAATTYTGDTYIVGGCGVTVDNVFPNGARAGDVYVYGRLAMVIGIGASFTINGLNGTGQIAGDHSAGGKTLVVGSNGDSGNFSGSIVQSGNEQQFIKIGTGTQILSGTNSNYQGQTIIKAGILSVVSLNSSGGGPLAMTSSSLGAPKALTADATIPLGSVATNAQLTYVGPGETTDRTIDLAGTTGGGALDASGTGPLVFTTNFTASGAGSKTLTLKGVNTAANTIQGCITNNSAVNRTSLLKDGLGRWVLSGTNSYTGPTTVTNGTLAINGMIVSPATVWSNAVLTGTGAIVTNNATAVTVNAGGILDPGSVGGIGTLTVTGNVAFAAGSILRLQANGATADLLAVSGNVTGAVAVPVTVTATGFGPWKVMTAASIAPTFTTSAPGWSLVKRNSNTELWLQRQGGTAILLY